MIGVNCKITIADGATITLNKSTINGSNELNQSIQYAGLKCEGSATIILEEENTVNGFFEGAGIFVPKGSTLTIKGSGKLNAYGKSNDNGIGGAFNQASGNIIIEGGTITIGDFITVESIEGESVTYNPSIKSYNVVFNANGGSGEMASITLLPGFTTHIPQTAFTL